MKRTGFAPPDRFDSDGKRRFSTFKNPGGSLRRTRLKRKPPRRLARRAADAPLVAFVRSLPCMYCQKPGPSDPAHMTLGPNEKGTSLKVSDRQCVPLCRRHHRYFDGTADGPRNPFRGFSKEERYALAAEWVRAIELAVTPEDLDSARELERAGLGRVIGDGTPDGWCWAPGTWSEVDGDALAAAGAAL